MKNIDYTQVSWMYLSYLFSGIQGIVYCLYDLIFGTYGMLWIPFELAGVVCFCVGLHMLFTRKIRLIDFLYQRPMFEKMTDFIVFLYGMIYLIMRKNLDAFGDPIEDVFCIANIVLFGCSFIGRMLVDLTAKEGK